MKAKAEPKNTPKEPGCEAGLLYIYGRHPVLAALRRRCVRQLWIAPSARGESIAEMRRLAAEQGLEVLPFDARRFPSEDFEVHQGVRAKVIAPEPRRDFEVFVEKILAQKKQVLFLLLDGIEDPQNFGALLRTAECAGVDGVIIASRHRAPLGAATVKASAGAVLSVTIVEVGNLHQTVRFLKENGIWVVAAASEGEVRYSDFDWQRHVALIMGAEGRGVSHLLQKVADVRVRIPLRGEVESLNVSVAAGTLLFECLRQRSC